MAQVITPDLRPQISDHLAYLLAEWRGVPEVVAAWDDWHEHERLDFVLEWPIREDRLMALRKWQAQGVLTESQQAAYDELEHLVRLHRPALTTLLAD